MGFNMSSLTTFILKRRSALILISCHFFLFYFIYMDFCMNACVHVYLLLLWFIWKPEKDVRSLRTAFMNSYKPLYESSARTKSILNI